MITFIHVGTHDFKSTAITVVNNTLTICGYFIESSPAIGALIIVYATNDDSDIHYVRAEPKGDQRNIKMVHDLGKPNIIYNLSIFVVDVSGLPFNRSIGKTHSVSGTSSHQLKSEFAESEFVNLSLV